MILPWFGILSEKSGVMIHPSVAALKFWVLNSVCVHVLVCVRVFSENAARRKANPLRTIVGFFIVFLCFKST